MNNRGKVSAVSFLILCILFLCIGVLSNKNTNSSDKDTSAADSSVTEIEETSSSEISTPNETESTVEVPTFPPPEVDLGLEKVNVLRYVDGDTLWVIDENLNEYKVRFIGTCCEESASKDESKNTEGGRLASEYIKNIVSLSDTLYLQKDVSDEDQYGRKLRYIWLEYPKSLTDSEEISSKMLNAIMIRDGYAKVGYYKPNVTNYSVFKSLQIEAKENKVGLWKDYWN